VKKFSCIYTLVLTMVAAFVAPGFAQAQDQSNDSVLNDVYVQLYLARQRRAKLAVERTKQELVVATKKRDRAEALHRANAISAEELEEKRAGVEVAAIRVQETEASADEATTFVDIAVSRISIGLEMPICAEIR